VNALAGTTVMVRLALRRDRVRLPVWILVFVLVAASSASATLGLYPTAESRVHAAVGINATPALVAFYGQIYDVASLGAIAMVKLGGAGAAMVAVLTGLGVIRHTRAEEESGRSELLGAGVLGRGALLAAALLVAAGTCLVLGSGTALALSMTGLPAAGAFAFGASWAVTGLVFAAIALVSAQLTTGSRAANGITMAVLGVSYLLRAIGDSSGPGWLSWCSPIGWAQQVRPFAGNRWWVLVLGLVFAALVSALGFALAGRRDLGAGLLPDRPGPSTGAPGLGSPLGLAWRLHRGALLAWGCGFVLLGLIFGSIASGVSSLVDSDQSREMIQKLGGQQGLTDAFLATELGFLAIFASVYGIQAALRLRGEEVAQRAEPLLATAVGRIRWAGGHLLIVLAGTSALLLVAGLSAGGAHAVSTGDPSRVGVVVAGAIVQLPAVWVVAGIVVALFGLRPRLVVASWAALAGFVLVGQFGQVLGLDQWALDLSPFTHVPRLPGQTMNLIPVVWLLLVAGVLMTLGLAGFRRRDLD
jgi:ABC-2 type transport system permease protein